MVNSHTWPHPPPVQNLGRWICFPLLPFESKMGKQYFSETKESSYFSRCLPQSYSQIILRIIKQTIYRKSLSSLITSKYCCLQLISKSKQNLFTFPLWNLLVLDCTFYPNAVSLQTKLHVTPSTKPSDILQGKKKAGYWHINT